MEQMRVTVKSVQLTKAIVRQLDWTWGDVDPKACHPIARIACAVVRGADYLGTSDVALLEWSDGQYTIWMDAALYMRDFYNIQKVVILK